MRMPSEAAAGSAEAARAASAQSLVSLLGTGAGAQAGQSEVETRPVWRNFSQDLMLGWHLSELVHKGQHKLKRQGPIISSAKHCFCSWHPAHCWLAHLFVIFDSATTPLQGMVAKVLILRRMVDCWELGIGIGELCGHL